MLLETVLIHPRVARLLADPEIMTKTIVYHNEELTTLPPTYM
jgi:hypothetical protein